MFGRRHDQRIEDPERNAHQHSRVFNATRSWLLGRPPGVQAWKVKGHTLLTISEIFVFFTQIYADNKAVPHYIYSNGSPPVFVRYWITLLLNVTLSNWSSLYMEVQAGVWAIMVFTFKTWKRLTVPGHDLRCAVSEVLPCVNQQPYEKETVAGHALFF